MKLKEIRCVGVNSVHLTKDSDRFGGRGAVCEHGNGSSCSIKGGDFVNYLRDYHILKQCTASLSELIGNLNKSGHHSSASQLKVALVGRV